MRRRVSASNLLLALLSTGDAVKAGLSGFRRRSCMRPIAVVLTASLALTGCISGSGGRTIRRNYATYNHTIHYNQSQQMLLNLVRMRYRESPLFLKVGAVSTSYNLEVNGGAHLGESFEAPNYGVNAGGSYSERPTVTYTPIEGDTFVKQMLAEVDKHTFILLYRSGWPIEVLCHVLAEQIGTSVNNLDDPSYPEFVDLVNRLAAAQDERRLVGIVVDDEVHMQIKDTEGGAERVVPLDSLQLRSFVDIMFFLGKNTRVPDENQDQVKPAQSNGWLDIRYSNSPPNDATVWVEYNGHFYSIARSDIRSKDTFALLKLLFEMQAGDIQSVQPILTLPLATP